MSLSVDPVVLVRRERGDPCARGEAALTDLRPSNPHRDPVRRSTPSCTECGTAAGLAVCRSGEQCRAARAGEERASAVRRRDVGQRCPPTSLKVHTVRPLQHRRNVQCSLRSESSTRKQGSGRGSTCERRRELALRSVESAAARSRTSSMRLLCIKSARKRREAVESSQS